MNASDAEKNIPETTSIALFHGNRIRKTLHNGEWWFSVIDVIEALTGSERSSAYWTAMKARVHSEDGFQLSTICRQLKLEAPDGKMRETDCADVEGMFRVIQSIPSPKAEPFKRWLARVVSERRD
ncbi:MAG: Bro-N domain-containing protein [Patescibacteria group bacterium]